MRVLALLVAKDLRLRMRDRTVLLAGFVAPLLLATITSVAFGGVERQMPAVRPIRLAIADDRAGAADLLRAGLEASEVRELVRATTAPTGEAARRAVADDRADVAMILPAGFLAATEAGRATSIEVVVGADQVIAGEVTRAIAREFASRLAADYVAVTAVRSLQPGVAVEEVRRAAHFRDHPVTLDTAPTGEEDVKMASYFGPSMAILFLFFTMSLGAKSLFVEHRAGLVDRVRASPVGDRAIVAGKCVSMCVVGGASVGVMWAASVLLFGATWGDPAAVVLLAAALIAAALGVSSLVASLAHNDQDIDVLVGLTTFMLGLLGGNFLPYQMMPEAMRHLSRLTPHGWGLQGFSDLVALGGGVRTVLPAAGIIAGIAAATVSLAVWRLGRWDLR